MGDGDFVGSDESGAGVNVSLVPTHLVDNIWHAVTEGFQRASKRFGGDLTVADLWVGCRSGNCFLFLIQDEAGAVVAAMVFKPETWGRGQRFRCLAMYGEGMKDWRDAAFALVTDIARQAGCNGLIADAREGIGVMFPDARKVRSVFEMDI